MSTVPVNAGLVAPCSRVDGEVVAGGLLTALSVSILLGEQPFSASQLAKFTLFLGSIPTLREKNSEAVDPKVNSRYNTVPGSILDIHCIYIIRYTFAPSLLPTYVVYSLRSIYLVARGILVLYMPLARGVLHRVCKRLEGYYMIYLWCLTKSVYGSLRL